MQRIAIAEITENECEEYISVLEKRMAYRSLKKIVSENEEVAAMAGLAIDENLWNELENKTRECDFAISLWWDRVDENYILEHDESRVMVVDFAENIIYSMDKRDWYRDNY